MTTELSRRAHRAPDVAAEQHALTMLATERIGNINSPPSDSLTANDFEVVRLGAR